MTLRKLSLADPHGADAGAVSDAWFDAPLCRNCGVPRDTPYCAACGQKAAARLRWRDMARETWERLRVFEYTSVRTLGRLLFSPGTVARDYVMGRRSAHVHPLKMLVALVAILVLMLAANRYFSTYGFQRDGDVDRMAERVIAYANWSFSLGIFAIFAGGWSVFGRRLGYNVIEHAVCAVYTQNLILAVIVVNLLPTLIWRDPAFILGHKAASLYYVPVIKLLIVAIAYKQFFLLNVKKGAVALAAACLVYLGVSWAILRLYAMLILSLVAHGY